MMDTTADKSPSLLGKNNDDQGVAAALARAMEKLSTGVLEEAHKILVRLIRKHHNDADVIFNLALARKRLGYDVSAEALFRQAFERGYQFPRETPAKEIEGKDNHLVWTDPTGEVMLEVWQRPRRSALTWIGFVEEEPGAASAAKESSDSDED